MNRFSAFVRALLVIASSAPLVACDGKKTGPPATPRLVSGALLGARACGSYSIHQRTLSFTCDPLPTSSQTGWQLRPLLKPPNSQGTQWLNRVVVLTVATETGMDLSATYVTEIGSRLPMRKIPDGPGEPASVTGRQQFAWAASDDGTTKTWTLKFIIDSCTTDAEVQVSATNAAGTSAPLSAILMRDPNELECISSSGGGGVAIMTSPTGPRPTGSSPSGSCPGGGQPRQFGVCENCANGHPPSMNRWSGGEYCDEAELRAVYGYTDPLVNPTPKAQLCTIRIEPNRASCETP
jgi:hypothetical protein